MATYTDSAGNVYTHDDDKLAFDDWINDNTERQAAWWVAAAKHKIWQEANPSAHPSDANDEANTIFETWREYANARRTAST